MPQANARIIELAAEVPRGVVVDQANRNLGQAQAVLENLRPKL